MTRQEFIEAIAPIICQYAAAYGYKFPSAIIAQACIESGFGTSSLAWKYHNYFGIKWYRGCGRYAVNLKTNEEYVPGILTGITAGFMVGDDLEDGVAMYFQFLARNSRYSNLKSATSAKHYCELIKADGYATSSTYVSTLLDCITQYNLQKYDGAAPEPKLVSYAAIVTASALRVRTGPTTAYPVMQVADHDFLLPYGMVIAVSAELGSWCRIAGIDGWASGEYLKH